jgi:hypothetical protein
MGPFFHNGFSLMEGARKRMKIGKEEILWIVKVWKNLCESTWRRWDLVLERGPFFFGTVYLIMHMSLNWDQVTYTTKYAKMLLHSELSLKFLQGSSCPTRWPRFKWVLGGYPLVGPSCWASTHFTCEIGTRVGTMIQF